MRNGDESGFWSRGLPLSVAGGAAIGLSGAPNLWPALGFVGPALLVGALETGARTASPRRAFVLGLVMATATNAVAFYWVVGLLTAFAGFPLVAAIATALLLWVAQSIAFALAAAGTAVLTRRGIETWLALPPCLVIACTLTPSLFPWRLAETQIPWISYVQVAELGGEPLLDLLVAAAGCGLAQAWRSGRRAPMWIAVAALCLPAVYGGLRLPAVRHARAAAPLLRVGVVQPNIGMFEKHDRDLAFEHLADLQIATRELERNGADVVAWPETAHPFAIPRERGRDSDGATRIRARGVRGPVLVGAITVDRHQRRYNSVVGLDRAGEVVGIADKVDLLAFGEYVPFWDYIPPLQERFGRGLTPGDAPRAIQIAGARVGVLNCYEDTLPGRALTVARQMPDFLLNATNDAWFGDTSEPRLHQTVARLRAVETRRDLVRAVNTGISSHTLATGEDVVHTRAFVATHFLTNVRLLDGVTPWVRFGDLTTPALVGMLFGVMLALRRRGPA